MKDASGDGSPRVRTLEVSAESAGQRIDNFLLRELRGVPRTRIYRLLRRGEVRVNGGRARPARRLEAGDRVRIPPVRAERHAGGQLPAHLLERLRSAVLHEDAEVLVIDKPAGMAVHAGTGLGGGVVDGLRSLRPDIERLELVHRLDRDTSGCLLLAKGRGALRRLQDALRDGAFDKTYHALLVGHWPGPEAVVEAPLARDVLRSGERMVRVDAAGRDARSHFRRLEGTAGLTRVEVRIDTGRTHQIRVHAAHLGHPVAGDTKYGDLEAERVALGRAAPRLFLHASRLGFPGRDGRLTITSPLPPAFEAALGGGATR